MTRKGQWKGAPVPPGVPDPPSGDAPGFGRAVPVEWIVVEPGFNIRHAGVSDEEMDRLGQSLQSGGQSQPCLGDRLESGQIRLASGHRRYFATLRAGLPTIWVEPIDHKAPQIERWIQNAVDNLARRELTIAERAEVFHRLGRKWQELLPDIPRARIDSMIAVRCSVSRQQVSTYRRYVERLVPEVFEAWKNAPELITVRFLDRLIKLSPPEQLDALAKLREGKFDSELPNEGSSGRSKHGPRKPMAKKLQQLAELFRTREATGFAPYADPKWAEGVIFGLELAMGRRKLNDAGYEVPALRVVPAGAVPEKRTRELSEDEEFLEE